MTSTPDADMASGASLPMPHPLAGLIAGVAVLLTGMQVRWWGPPPGATRQWLAAASADALFEQATADLYTVYGPRLRRHMLAARLTVRAHAMASPSPGFLANSGLAALRAADGPILFAHADLSGLSLFEEAAWWGDVAAQRVLG